MKRWFLVAILFCMPAWAAVIKLYLKDGTYQLAREYQVVEDRVKFYSTDRGEWEEIPLDLVDLKKTEKEIKEREEEVREDTKANAEEDKAERAAAREIAKVPHGTGRLLCSRWRRDSADEGGRGESKRQQASLRAQGAQPGSDGQRQGDARNGWFAFSFRSE